MNSVRCLIQGSFSVGKTTLIQESLNTLQSKYKIAVAPDVARVLATKGIFRDSETRIEDYFAYYYQHLAFFNSIYSDIVLFDRSVLDVMTFARMSFGNGSWIEQLGGEIFNAMRSKIHKVVYIPIEVPIVHDGVRSTDESLRSTFDTTLHSVFKDYNVSVSTICGPLVDRISQFSSLLDSLVSTESGLSPEGAYLQTNEIAYSK